MTLDVVGTEAFSAVVTADASLRLTAFPPTGTPTITPSPTFTASPRPDYVQMTFRLSWYDPHIGAYFPEIRDINCLVWSDELNDCVSKVNNGRDEYNLWYRRGVACPPPLHDGQQIRVIEPLELARISDVWTCIDRGGAIVGDYLDFMLRYPDDIWTGGDLTAFRDWWGVPVRVELLP